MPTDRTAALRTLRTLRTLAVLAVLTVLTLGTAACGRGGGAPPSAAAAAPVTPAPEPFAAPERLYYDNGGGIPDSVRMVIRDEGAFRDAWTRATSRQSMPPAPPEVAFDRQMVVVAGAGRLSTDDEIRVDSARVVQTPDADGAMESVLEIFVRTTRGCRQFNVDAWPLELVRIRRFDGTIRFREALVQAECAASGLSGSTER